jgi:hypothetical protein
MNLRIVEDTDDLLLLELTGSLDLSGGREIETPFLAHVTLAKQPVILDFFTSKLSCLVRNENAL